MRAHALLALVWAVTGAQYDILKTVDTPGTARDVAVEGNFAYVADTTAVLVIDISDKAAANIVHTIPETDPTIGLAVSGNRLYVAAGNTGMQIFDITTPTTPTLLATYKHPTEPDGFLKVDIQTVGSDTIAYLLGTIKRMFQVNVNDPMMMVSLSISDANSGGTSAQLFHYAFGSFTSFYWIGTNAGIESFDVSTTAATARILSQTISPNGAHDITVAQSHCLVISDLDMKVQSNNPNTPIQSAAYNVNAPFYSIEVDASEQFAYIVGSQFIVVSLATITMPVEVSTKPLPGTDPTIRYVIRYGGTLYITDGDAGLHIMDVAPPTPAPDTPVPDTNAPDTPAPATNVPDTSAPDTPAPATPAPDTPAPDTPAPDTPAPDTPAPDTPAPATPAPDTPAPDTPAPATPVPDTPAPDTPAPDTLAPDTPAPDTPAPETPAPDTPAPDTPAPDTKVPNTPAPDTPAPITPAPDTPAPNTPAPDTPAPDTPAPDTPAPDTPAPDTPAPDTPAPDTPAPDTPAPDTPAPDTLAPDTPAPDTPAPATPAPSTPAPDTPAPATAAPDTPAPDTSAPNTNAPPTPAPPTDAPATLAPATLAPDTPAPPTGAPATPAPATPVPKTMAPQTPAPPTLVPATTTAPATGAPSTFTPETSAPATATPTAVPTQAPSTAAPATRAPATAEPTASPSTASPSTASPSTASPSTVSPPLPTAPPTIEPTAAPTPVPTAAGSIPKEQKDFAKKVNDVNPASAKLVAVLNIKCEVEDIDLGEEPLDWEFHPIGVPLGDHSHKHFLGAVVFNTTIVILFLAVNHILVVIQVAIFKIDWGDAVFYVRAPGLVYIPVLWLMMGTSLASSNMAFFPGHSPAYVPVVGWMGLMYCVGVPVSLWMLLMKKSKFHATTVPDPQIDRKAAEYVTDGPVEVYTGWKRRAYIFIFGSEVWVKDGGQDYFVEQYGMFFEQYRCGYHWFGLFEMGQILLLSFGSAWKPSDSGSCTLRNVLLVVVLVTTFLFTVFLRPFNSVLDQLVGTIMSFFMATAVVLMTISLALDPGPPVLTDIAGMLLVITAFLLLLKGVYDLCFYFLDIFLGRRRRAFKASRQRSVENWKNCDNLPLDKRDNSDYFEMEATVLKPTPPVPPAPESHNCDYSSLDLGDETDFSPLVNLLSRDVSVRPQSPGVAATSFAVYPPYPTRAASFSHPSEGRQSKARKGKVTSFI